MSLWLEGLALPSDPERATVILQGEPWPKLPFGSFLALQEELRKSAGWEVGGQSLAQALLLICCVITGRCPALSGPPLTD